jgi:hypothetical protein
MSTKQKITEAAKMMGNEEREKNTASTHKLAMQISVSMRRLEFFAF